MPECQYCNSTFDTEDAYLKHLKNEHRSELGPIDRKRVGLDKPKQEDEGGVSTGIVVLVLIIGVSVIVGGGVVLLTSDGDGAGTTVEAAQQPRNVGSVHYHGTMVMAINGERVDFSQDRYQLQADAFHFEGGGATRWHVHAQGVTLEFALATLGIDVTESTVTFQGTTYRDASSGISVSITVNDESVTPAEYVLQPDDRIRIVISEN